MSSAWDPATGMSLRDDELTALLGAAGASPNDLGVPVHVQQEMARSGDVLAVRLVTAGDAELDRFYTRDVHQATTRICTFLNRVVDLMTRIVVECGAMSAMVCLDASGRYSAAFMNRQLCSCFGMEPATVMYSADKIAEWAMRVATTFLGVAGLERRSRAVMELGEQRRTAAGGVADAVPPTPTTPWLWP